MSNYFLPDQLVEHQTHGLGRVVGHLTTSGEPRTITPTKPRKFIIYRVRFGEAVYLCDPRRLQFVYPPTRR